MNERAYEWAKRAGLAAPRRAGLLCLNAATVRLGLNSGCIHKWNIHKFVGFRRAGCSCEAWASFSSVLNHATTSLRLIARICRLQTPPSYVLLCWPPVQIWLDRRVPSEGGRALMVECTLSPSSFRDSLTCTSTAPAVSTSFPTVLSFRRCYSNLFKLSGLFTCPTGLCHVLFSSIDHGFESVNLKNNYDIYGTT